mgnify:CR=1 FL=1
MSKSLKCGVKEVSKFPRAHANIPPTRMGGVGEGEYVYDNYISNITNNINDIDSHTPQVSALVQISGNCPIIVTLPGLMMGKERARSTRRGRHYTPAATVAAENAIAAAAMAQVGAVRLSGPLGVSIHVRMAVPDSWSARKRAAALRGDIRPTGKPDWDNMAKLVCDALNGILWLDDAQIVDGRLTKFYAAEAATVLTVWQEGGAA